MTYDLREILALEPLELNLFRGRSADPFARRIYGGQVVAQALLAAYATVEERTCHSLHCYFIRPGDPSIPIIFEVDRARDGASFTTRRVIAVQRGRQILNLAASFKIEEPGFTHQAPMPAGPAPDALHSISEMLQLPEDGRYPSHFEQIEMRLDSGPREVGPPRQRAWFRLKESVGDDPRWRQAALAYASDMGFLGACMRAHGADWGASQVASLDHAVWFHRPAGDLAEWHLYESDSPSASNACGFNRGSVYRADGVLVASCAQEGLIRPKEPPPAA